MNKVAIIGAGISGLFIANLFKKNSNYKITIYEKNNSIGSDQGYGVQLSVNSIKLLNKIGFEKLLKTEKFTPKKIDFYSNNTSSKICTLDISDFNSLECKYTTLKRSILINFLKKDLENSIKTGYDISKIDCSNKTIQLTFENKKISEYDYVIISDGVFSKSKNIILNKQIKPKYNNTLAIRGVLTKSSSNIDNNNISIFLGPNFHQVIYPTNSLRELNFIAIIKYKLTLEQQKNSLLFKDKFFMQKVLKKVPVNNREFLINVDKPKLFPVFISDNFYKVQNKNIHLIGDAFFAFPPSFAQGASQSIESAYELFQNIENSTETNFFENRVKKTKMVSSRSKFNQFAFHLTNPLTIIFRNIFMKRLVKNKIFLETYLGKIYK
tara:strand:- start:79 stop:1221 length:1143 start_codon:yes stop_codon:yes gene_type:complete